jgi:hypothetical protein
MCKSQKRKVAKAAMRKLMLTVSELPNWLLFRALEDQMPVAERCIFKFAPPAFLAWLPIPQGFPQRR